MENHRFRIGISAKKLATDANSGEISVGCLVTAKMGDGGDHPVELAFGLCRGWIIVRIGQCGVSLCCPVVQIRLFVPLQLVDVEHLGPIAQGLEQATHNRLVGGSNPSGPPFKSRVWWHPTKGRESCLYDFLYDDGTVTPAQVCEKHHEQKHQRDRNRSENVGAEGRRQLAPYSIRRILRAPEAPRQGVHLQNPQADEPKLAKEELAKRVTARLAGKDPSAKQDYGVLSRGLLSGSRPAAQGDLRARFPPVHGPIGSAIKRSLKHFRSWRLRKA